MPNVFQNVEVIAAMVNEQLFFESNLIPLVSMDESGEFAGTVNGHRKGDTVKIRTGPQYTARDYVEDANVTVQDIESITHNLVVDQHKDITVKLSAKKMALNFEGWMNEVIRPAAKTIAQVVDQHIGTRIVEGSNIYYSTTLLESRSDASKIRKAAREAQLMNGGEFAVIDNDLASTMLGADWVGKVDARGSEGQMSTREGDIGRIMGINWNESDNFQTLNFRPDESAGVVSTLALDGAAARGATSITVDDPGTANKGIADGAWITVAGATRGMRLRNGVSNGETTITPYFPVEQDLADNAIISVVGAGATMYVRGALFDKKCVGLAFGELESDSEDVAGANVAVVTQNGVSIRVAKWYEGKTKTHYMSIDALYGAKLLDPRRVTVLAGDS